MEAFINYIISERNGSDNIVILVPTRALINQVTIKLKQEIKNSNYKILTHPVIPDMYRKHNHRYVFIFTPERWISYISNPDNPIVTYMFIDEAQKAIAQKIQEPRYTITQYYLLNARVLIYILHRPIYQMPKCF